MKLPKYNLSYNTRDLIHSLAKSTCERKYDFFIIIAKVTFPFVFCFQGREVLLHSQGRSLTKFLGGVRGCLARFFCVAFFLPFLLWETTKYSKLGGGSPP